MRGVTSKHSSDSYCLDCLPSFRTKKGLKSHKKLWINKIFCSTGMPFVEKMLLTFAQYQASSKAPSILFVNLEYSVKKQGYIK